MSDSESYESYTTDSEPKATQSNVLVRRRKRKKKVIVWHFDKGRRTYREEIIGGSMDSPRHTDPRPASTETAWRQLPIDERHDLHLFPAFSMASADSFSRQRLGVNLPEHIPPELFDGIIYFLDEKRSSKQSDEGGYSRTLRRYRHEEHQEDDTLDSLRTGSLVCRYWSNRCRRWIFLGSSLCITSSDDLDFFLKYAKGGCATLVPIYKFIGRIDARQGYDATSYSFLHRLRYIASLRSKRIELGKITLLGPIPDQFPRHKLATPHWSVPPAIVTPPSLLAFEDIRIENIHIPSFRHVVKYVRYLTHTTHSVEFEKFTWDSESPVASLPLVRVSGPRKLILPSRKKIFFDTSITSIGCTDNFRLCLYSALARPDFPLYWLPRPDIHEACRLITSLWELYFTDGALTQGCVFDWEVDHYEVLSSDAVQRLTLASTTYEDSTEADFQVMFAFESRFQTSPPFELPKVFLGCYISLHIGINHETSLNGNALFALLGGHPELPFIGVHLLFDNYEQLRIWTQASSFPIQNNRFKYALICTRKQPSEAFPEIPPADKHSDSEANPDYLRIDSSTLVPIGLAQQSSGYFYFSPKKYDVGYG